MAAELDKGLIADVLAKWNQVLDSPKHEADAFDSADEDFVWADRASSVLVRVGLCTLNPGPRPPEADWEPPPLTIRLAADVPELSDEAVVALLLDSISVPGPALLDF
jgi:hypothetical protein